MNGGGGSQTPASKDRAALRSTKSVLCRLRLCLCGLSCAGSSFLEPLNDEVGFHFTPLDFQPGTKVKVSECNPLGVYTQNATPVNPTPHHPLSLTSAYTLPFSPTPSLSLTLLKLYRPVLCSLILQPHLRLGGKSASSVTKPFFCCPLWVLELKEEFRMASPSHSRDRRFSSLGAAFYGLIR